MKWVKWVNPHSTRLESV